MLFRSKIMAELADEIFLAYFTEGGNLDRLFKNLKGKKIRTFE